MIPHKQFLGWFLFAYASGALNVVSAGTAIPAQAQALAIVKDQEYLNEKAVPASDVFSDNGKLAAHRESGPFGDKLLLKNLVSGESKILFDTNPKNEPQLGSVITVLAFSPDATQLMFMIGGDTWYYPTDVMTIGVDGENLKQLTNATPARFLTKPSDYSVDHAWYAPDGQNILLSIQRVVDSNAGNDAAIALIRPGLTKQPADVIAGGDALFWSVDGKSIFFQLPDGRIGRADSVTHTTTIAVAQVTHTLGRVPGFDAVFVADQSTRHLSIVNLSGSPVDGNRVAMAAAVPIRDTAGRTLESVKSLENQLILTYVSGRYRANFSQVHQQLVNFPPKDLNAGT